LAGKGLGGSSDLGDLPCEEERQTPCLGGSDSREWSRSVNSMKVGVGNWKRDCNIIWTALCLAYRQEKVLLRCCHHSSSCY
jgi:hypothetical protein